MQFVLMINSDSLTIPCLALNSWVQMIHFCYSWFIVHFPSIFIYILCIVILHIIGNKEWRVKRELECRAVWGSGVRFGAWDDFLKYYCQICILLIAFYLFASK